MKEQVVKLYREAQTNPSLRDTLNTAPNTESFVELANEKGFTFTLEEWQEMTNFSVEELKGDLSEIPGI
jgi:predicted ribosomally synthesized peptide with nif11-like leader